VVWTTPYAARRAFSMTQRRFRECGRVSGMSWQRFEYWLPLLGLRDMEAVAVLVARSRDLVSS
jgi:hypothetical protein